MSALTFITGTVNSGVNDKHSSTFTDKLKSRNRLAMVCVGLSFIYFFYFLKQLMPMPFLAISIVIILFLLTITLNRFEIYRLSNTILLITTNLCVLFFSVYLGFNSGIHLYLFTSPLIVLTAFDTKNIKLISIIMSTYLINYILITLIDTYFTHGIINLSATSINFFYHMNFIGTIFILIVLSFYFLSNNNKTNELLRLKNNELFVRQFELDIENKIRKDAEISATEALAEKELLLSEIHHRVKNNLAVVSGLLELHTMNVKDSAVLKVVKESQNRIKSIAILHEMLYENKSLKEIEIRDYVEQLMVYVSNCYSIINREVNFKINIESISLEMTKAMPFGLLLNELTTNSYKHAFHETSEGVIAIEFRKIGADYELIYTDNGPGFLFTHEVNRNSLGLILIETFSKQLNGTYGFTAGANGLTYKIIFN